MKKLYWHTMLILSILIVSLIARLWALDLVPPSLFGDELDAAYHAYSFLQTGKDYMGNFFPVHLESLADSKPPLLPYTLIPSVAFGGINPLTVRLPIALFSVLSLLLAYLVTKQLTENNKIALLVMVLLSITPWHWHFSRVGLEVMEMFTVYLGAIYFFWKGLKDNRWLLISAALLGLTVWIYHSAKVFLPLSILMLIFVGKNYWHKLNHWILLSGVILTIIATPIFLDTLFGSGGNRFGSTSVFNQAIMEGEIGNQRFIDTIGNNQLDLTSKLFHNQWWWSGQTVLKNYFQAFSLEFLFIQGDPNLRHQVQGFGLFFPIQAVLLVLGIYFLITKSLLKEKKIFIGLWLLMAPLPAVLTVGGGTHAIRLMLMLYPLVFIMAIGLYYGAAIFRPHLRLVYTVVIGIALSLSVFFYQHAYWVHYPIDSQRWWTYGYEEAVKGAIAESSNYQQVFISGADEPPILQFLSWSQYPPKNWQNKFLSVELTALGEAKKLGQFYFTPTGKEFDIYTLASVLPSDTLYIATQKEVKLNLIEEPERLPDNLELLKTITYPNSEPAFYFLRMKKNLNNK